MKMKKKLMGLMALVLTLIVICASCGKTDEAPEPTPTPDVTSTVVAEEKDDIFYTNMTTSVSRPIAVMIDNDYNARPHTGIENAFAVYEMVVEGDYTRLMALFKDCNSTKIGPVRSARHYFLDYALEHDAIYTHCGWSPQAQNDISALDVDNVNEISSNNGKNFYRDRNKRAPHNLYTSLPDLISSVTNKYHTTSKMGNVFSYNKKDADLAETAENATKVTVPYFNSYKVTYEYDADKKVYKRFINSNPHITATDGSTLTAKNIIIYKVRNYSIDDYGRQNLKTVGSGSGWYISNGRVVPINWRKDARSAKTIYTTEDGEKLSLNPGNVYIQIIPETSNITIE